MKKHCWLWFVLALLFIAGCGSDGKGEQDGLILYQALDNDGRPASELVVIDPSGKELRRISFDGSVIGVDTQVKVSHRTVVFTPDDASYLIDAKQGTVQHLADKVYPGASQFRFSGGGERWTLLGNPRGDVAYLVDLKTAQVHDLMTLDEGAPFILFGLFAPGEAHLAVQVGSDFWLAPTTNLSEARRLGTGKSVYRVDFSSDGKQIVYLQRTEADETEVVVETMDGSRSEVVATSDLFFDVAFVSGQNQLFLEGSDTLSILSLDSGKEKELLAFSGRLWRLWFAPSGKKVLIGGEDDEAMTWHLVDLNKGTDQTLDDLEEYDPYFWDQDHRWVIFVDDISLGVGGRRFVSLDLESGETHQALVLDEEILCMGLRDLSSDGKFGLVTTLTEDDRMQLWLLQADGGEARLLVEAKGSVYGALSPDGRWVAVSTLEKTDDRVENRLMLMETEGEETRSLGEGYRPIWVRP